MKWGICSGSGHLLYGGWVRRNQGRVTKKALDKIFCAFAFCLFKEHHGRIVKGRACFSSSSHNPLEHPFFLYPDFLKTVRNVFWDSIWNKKQKKITHHFRQNADFCQNPVWAVEIPTEPEPLKHKGSRISTAGNNELINKRLICIAGPQEHNMFRGHYSC